MLSKVLFFVLNLICFLNSEEISLNINKTLAKNWLSSCSMNKCVMAITQCSTTSCSGYPTCQTCIADKDPLCFHCSSEIFNTNNMIDINGNRYLTCDQNDVFQNYVCRIYCRDSLSKLYGECKPIESFSACFCYSSFNGNIYKTISQTSGIIALTVRSGSNEFAVGLNNGEVRIYDNYGNFLRNFVIEFGRVIYGLVYLYNGDIAATGDFGTRLYTNDGLETKSFTTSSSRAIVLLKNNQLAFSYGNSICIWTANSNSAKFILNGHQSTVFSLVVLDNGYLASGSADNSIRIWDSNNGNLVSILNGHTDWVRSIIVLENGDLASCSDDRTIRIWDLKNGSVIRTIQTDHSNFIISLSILPNGRIASGSRDNDIKIWNKEVGELEKTLKNGHTSWINNLAVNHNNYLVSVSDDGNIILWN